MKVSAIMHDSFDLTVFSFVVRRSSRWLDIFGSLATNDERLATNVKRSCLPRTAPFSQSYEGGTP